MRKSSILTAFATAAATAVLVGGPAVAGNGHFIASATSVTSSGTELTVKFKEAGLEPPKTWDDYLEAAATFDGQDLNGDGEPDYGSCISKARAQQAYWWIYTIAAP